MSWLGVVSLLILVWFGLDAYDRTRTRWRDKSREIDAHLEVFEAAHPRPEGEK